MSRQSGFSLSRGIRPANENGVAMATKTQTKRSKREASPRRKALVVFVSLIMVWSMSPWSQISWADESQSTTTESTEQATTTDDSATSTDEATTSDEQAADEPAATDAQSDEQASAEEPSSDAPTITTQSTAEEDGEYSITIDYVDESGNKLQPSWQGLATSGQTWSKDSPTIDGYELADSTQATLSGTASGDSHYLTFTVTYKKATATYTVTHMKELSPGAYYVADTETLTATAGDTVTVTPKTYSGYKCVTTDLSLTVSADNNASIVLYYDQDPMNYAIYFYTQGTYIAPITGGVGSAVTAPADPTRTGYTFAGWDIDGDGTADTLPTTIPDHNVSAVALWTPQTVNYTIVYWEQDQTDNSKYDFVEATTASGIADSTTPAAPVKNVATGTYKWYQYGHEDAVTIKADGSSVLNVYYDLVDITVNEIVNNSVYKTSTVKFGSTYYYSAASDVEAFYQAATGTSNAYLSYWEVFANEANGNIGHTTINEDRWGRPNFDTKTLNITAVMGTGTYYLHAESYVFQNFDGTYPDTSSIITATTKDVASHRGEIPPTIKGFTVSSGRWSGVWDGDNYDALTWGSWDVANTGLGSFSPSLNFLELRYSRNTYQAVYMSGSTQVASVNHLYEAPYTTTTDCDGSTLTDPTGQGRVFGGWYTNSSFAGTPVTDATMAYQGTIYYAKWVPQTVTVTFDSNGGTAVDSETLDKDTTATQPADPTKASGAEFLGWYYVGANGIPVLYTFSEPVESNITLTAYWKPAHDDVAYTVVHETSDGTILANETGSGEATTTVGTTALSTSDSRRQGYKYVDASTKSIVLSTDTSKNVVTYVYSNDASHSYTVHYVDRATGATLASDYTFTSDKNLVDVTALDISGYKVEESTGWVSADKTECTFYYNSTAAPSMSLTKTVSSGTAAPGDTLTYTLTATNNGDAAATGYWVKDYVPSNTTYVSSDGTYGASSTGKEFASWFFDTIPAGESRTMTLTVKINECSDGTEIDNMALSEITGKTTPPTDIQNTDPDGGSSNKVTTIASSSTPVSASALPRTGDATPMTAFAALATAGLAAVAWGLRRKRNGSAR